LGGKDGIKMKAKQNIHANVTTNFMPHACEPVIDETAYVHPQAVVIGQVELARRVFVGPFASVRGDEGVPIYVGNESNIQDGVVLHALETSEMGREIEENLREVEGRKYAIYVGKRVSLAHQCQIHGPAVVLDDTFVGMQALVLNATVGRGCLIEPGAKIIGVNIRDRRCVPAGQVITTQQQADALAEISPTHPMYGLNKKVVHVNMQLANGYRAASR
jgi:carbonic anhydrase/acetyltransferase-like protein (isoleucine patch superfamily)